MTRIIEDVKLDFKDVLFVPKRSELSSRSEVSLVREITTKHTKYKFYGVPIIAANMDGVGTIKMAEKLKQFDCLVALTKHIKNTDIYNLVKHSEKDDAFIYSIGMTENDLDKWTAFKKYYNEFELPEHNSLSEHDPGAIIVCIDVANGYQQKFVEFCKKFREQNPETTIIAGNVVTPEMTQELILAGVDIVKVGIGPGSVCTTRKLTGVGYPQLSAVIECSEAAHQLGAHIISDGGCTTPGDIAKAFGAGADFVMLGGMLAGHTEGGGVVINDKIRFYGMSSSEAMKKHSGGVAEYRASEGKVVEIPYRGDVKNTIQEIFGGLRSTCTYVGAPTLKDLPKCTTFVRVTQTTNNIFGVS